MSAAYSLDFRERVMGTVEAGASSRRAAAVFKVSISTAILWRNVSMRPAPTRRYPAVATINQGRGSPPGVAACCPLSRRGPI
jgi:transposase